MASIINATTTNGLSTSADNSGSLQLATNNGTTAVTIDTSQNVGIGTASPNVTYRLDVVGNAGLRIQGGTTGKIDLRSASGNAVFIGMTEAGVADRGVIGFAAGSGDMQFRNNGAYDFSTGNERMRIDSSGRVTMPFQSGFAYIGAAVSYATGGNQIVFSGGSYNYDIGSMLNLTGGTGGASRATIPISGYYYVGVSLMGENDGSRIEAFVQRNGSNTLGVNSESTQYNNANMNAILYFAANDYIEIRRSTGTLYTGATNADIFFTVRLLG